MKKSIITLMLITLVTTSCTVTRTSTIKTMDASGAGVIQMPVIADLEVNGIRVTGNAMSKSGELLESVKNTAVRDAIKKTNADVLVEVRFTTETTNGRTEVTVTGYPANYKNFRPIKEDDIKLLEVLFPDEEVTYVPILPMQERLEVKQQEPKLELKQQESEQQKKQKQQK